jgi:hypothetical protein
MDNGLEIPDFVAATAVEVEGSVPSMAFSVPPKLNLDELSEEALSRVTGGTLYPD